MFCCLPLLAVVNSVVSFLLLGITGDDQNVGFFSFSIVGYCIDQVYSYYYYLCVAHVTSQ